MMDFTKHFIAWCYYTRRAPSSRVRVRFTPSLEGSLRLDGVRNALYNYIFARQNNGLFIVRIDDIDRTRLVPAAVQKILTDLDWLGVHIDEGPDGIGGRHGPYLQSERLQIYTDHIMHLVQTGKAYRCFCTEYRLNLLRRYAKQKKLIDQYDNRCRTITPNETAYRMRRGDPYCIRFRQDHQFTSRKYNDLIDGPIHDRTKNQGDPIILQSNGVPTNHIASVIDDHLMYITHVFRDKEWQIFTGQHLMFYKAFNWTPPCFGHFPVMVDVHGDELQMENTDIEYFRSTGIIPNALINFVVTTAGGFINDEEIVIKPKCYNLSQLSLRFNMKMLKRCPGMFDIRRLLDFNRIEFDNVSRNKARRAKLVPRLQFMLKTRFIDKHESLLQVNEDHIDHVLCWAVNHIQRLSDLLDDEVHFLWCTPEPNNVRVTDYELSVIRHVCKAIENDALYYSKQSINRYLSKTAEAFKCDTATLRRLFHIVLTGLKMGPGIADIMVILGKNTVLLRLKMFIEKSYAMRLRNDEDDSFQCCK